MALPALAAIYVLRTRYRRREVSSLMLWQAAAQATGGGRKASRMQTPWVLLLELLALLLLVLAATMPRWLATGQRARVMVVLDNSWSMRAVDADDREARARGGEAVADELAGLGRYTAGFVLAGRTPQRLGASARDAAGVRAALAGWAADDNVADLDAAVALARETGGADTRVVVVTDRPQPGALAPPPDATAVADTAGGVGPQVRWRAVGVPGDNAAVLRAVRGGDSAARDVVMVEVGRFAAAAGPARTVGLQIETLVSGPPAGPDAVWSIVARRRLALEPGASTRVWFDPDDAGAGAVRTAGRLLRASVTLPGDVLAADDRAWLAPPDATPVWAAVRVADPALADAVDGALAATGRTTPALADDAELLVTAEAFPAGADGPSTLAGPAGRWALRLFAPADTDAEATRAFLGPFLVDGAHPVMTDVGLEGVVWSAVADPQGLDAWARGADAVLAAAGAVPLMTWRGGDAAEIRMNLDAARSTLTGDVAWPSLISNVVRARVAARPGARPVNVPAGTPVTLRAGAAADESGAYEAAAPVARVRRLAGPDGPDDAAAEPATLALRDGVATWVPARPGVYAVELPGRTPQTMVAAGASAAESDLSGAATVAAGDLHADLLDRPEYRGLGWLLGLGALGLLGIEAWLLRGGVGRGGAA